MPLIPMLMTLIVIGVVLYLVSLLPLDATIKQIIQVLTIVFAILWILQLFLAGAGGFGNLKFCP